MFHSNDFLVEVEITQEEVDTYYSENSDDYMTLEEYEVVYVLLDRSEFEEGFVVSDEEVVLAYEAELEVAASEG